VAAEQPHCAARCPVTDNRHLEKKMAQRRTRRYSRGAGSEVEREMRRYKRGSARSGRGGRAGKVESRKQAIAIGLSKARKKGKKVSAKR
jgi:Family of unknown function (DUF6496)